MPRDLLGVVTQSIIIWRGFVICLVTRGEAGCGRGEDTKRREHRRAWGACRLSFQDHALSAMAQAISIEDIAISPIDNMFQIMAAASA
jgi:hypothetical protein